MVYAMVCTLVIAFGTIGAVFASNLAPQYALMGLFLGSALGAFISVYESTIIGCMAGMITGLAVSPLVYLYIDFETSYLVVFVLALFGAIMGEPLAYFWREAEDIAESDEAADFDETRDSSPDKEENPKIPVAGEKPE
jgi:phosphotransferase system  glucose/maltose/N-acetylglucosamine-specific IIC component